MKLFYIGAAVLFSALAAGAALAACPAPAQTGDICIQTVTWAKDQQTGVCCYYPTPCQAPQGWVTYNSASECSTTTATCRTAGQMCGGIAAGAFQCCNGLTCRLNGSYPDASGICVTPTDNKCGDGVCETQEAGYCVDCAHGLANCQIRCHQTACPQDCPTFDVSVNTPAPAPATSSANAIRLQIAAIRLQLVSLLQQLINILKAEITNN
jgi:hypothetical protein